MDHPDKPASVSHAPAGVVENEPAEVISLVVTDQNDDPIGLLEKWNGDAWFYVKIDSLKDLN